MLIGRACLCLLVSQAVQGWGPDGHRITGRIAEMHLNKKATKGVRQILGPGRGLADISNIADEVRNQKPETGPWHYVNIPISESFFDRARYCPQNHCVVRAVERFRDELNKSKASPAGYEALYNLVHFIGDLHQPLHCGDRGDQGGNNVKVVFLGQSSNLHRVWDSGIPDSLSLDHKVLGKVSRAEKAAWSRGSPEAWAIESHDLARDVVYRFPEPDSGPVVLDRGYVERGAPVVRLQLRRAGIRLAWVLNQALR